MSKCRDGTDMLCRAVYGREAKAGDYLGGSEASMLYDAAKEIHRLDAQRGVNKERIAELEEENAELRRYANERKDMIECAPGMTTGDVIKLVNEDRCQLFYLRPALEDKP